MKQAFILIVDGSVDQVCETRADAQRERRDLIAMGCTVKTVVCPWDKQDDVIAKIEG